MCLKNPVETNACRQIGGLVLIPSQSSEILSVLKNISISRLLTHQFDSDYTDSLRAELFTLHWMFTALRKNMCPFCTLSGELQIEEE